MVKTPHKGLISGYTGDFGILQKFERMPRLLGFMAVSATWESFGGSDIKSLTIWGSILGLLIFGNSRLGSLSRGC